MQVLFFGVSYTRLDKGGSKGGGSHGRIHRGLAPNYPPPLNEIFSECNWTCGMKN